MKHILITGGAGFVGSNLAMAFKKAYPSYTIYAFDNLRRRGSELNIQRLKDHDILFVHGDIRNREDLDIFEHIDVLIDAAADPSVLAGIHSPVFPLLAHNLFGTVNCMELADRHHAAFIFLSTSRVYPIGLLEACAFEEHDTRYAWLNDQDIPGVSAEGIAENFPLEGSRSFYGAGKLASELLLTEYGEFRNMKTIINRCGVISGPGQFGKTDQGVLSLWLAKHYFRQPLSYIGYGGSGKQVRDVLHIDDLFDIVNRQVHYPEGFTGNTFNVGGGAGISFSLKELTQLCEEVTGNTTVIQPVEKTRPADVRIYITDDRKINAVQKWPAKRDLETIIRDTFEWIHLHEKDLKTILA